MSGSSTECAELDPAKSESPSDQMGMKSKAADQLRMAGVRGKADAYGVVLSGRLMASRATDHQEFVALDWTFILAALDFQWARMACPTCVVQRGVLETRMCVRR